MKITLETPISASAEKVFSLMTEPDGYVGRISGIRKIERLQQGPVGVGTSFRETREVFGKEHTETLTFTRYEPHRVYSLRSDSNGCQFDSEFVIEPQGDGVLVRMTTTTSPQGFLARLLTPIQWLMKGMMRRMLDQDLTDIKLAAERR